MNAGAGARTLLRIVWVLAVIAIIAASLLPENSAPIRAIGALQINDKLEHTTAYAVLALLPELHERRKIVLASAVAAAALGVALEFLQPLTGRDFEIGDMIADAAGVCAGLWLGFRLRRTVLVRSFLGRS